METGARAGETRVILSVVRLMRSVGGVMVIVWKLNK
jgi:hypothetical protein